MIAFRNLPVMLFACALAAVKATVIAWTVWTIHRHHLAPSGAMTRWRALWLAAALGIAALLIWLLPPVLAPRLYVALGVFLWLPLGRLLLAPLALHWNRHR